jgi:HD-GYP domain-containing protein (c-di-GMP phosphodiesterase class II)
MIIGQEVISTDGVVLLDKGVRLKATTIVDLFKWNIKSVYIEDKENQPTEKSSSLSVVRASFLEEYTKTVEAVRQAFERIRHFNEVPIAKMQEIVEHTILVMVNTVGVLYYLHEVQRHSDYTFQHSVNVAVVSGVLAKWLDVKNDEQRNLVMAGLLHDIGKLFIPLPILDKPSKLSFFEYEAIKKHPQEGHRLLEYSKQLPRDVKLGILQHHERQDGSGYPYGFKGDEIHPYARVVAVADMYDAMTSDRTYRSRMTPLAAVETIADEMHNKLDTRVCLAFLNNMRDYLTGNTVLLSNGQRAKIVVVNDQSWTKPIVQTEEGVLLDLQREKLVVVDLMEN